VVDNFGHSQTGDCDQDEGEAEKNNQIELVEDAEIGSDNERYRKCDEEYIGDNVGDTHSDELRKALSTLWTRIRGDLPVVIEWLALGNCRNDDGKKGDGKKDADEA